MAKKLRTAKIITGVGVLLTVVGLILWWQVPMGTKLFQLSNDIVGAGLLTAVVAGFIWIYGATK